MTSDIQAALRDHAFEHLFIECLGWDRTCARVSLDFGNGPVEIEATAEKRGFPVFVCPVPSTVFGNRLALRSIHQQLRKTYREYILIRFCESPRAQLWQWAAVTSRKHRFLYRERSLVSDQPPLRLLGRLQGLARVRNEESLTPLEVLQNIRKWLRGDFQPSFAARGNRLAGAIKNGEPGALAAFIEFYAPLTSQASRWLVRSFGMDPEDAAQTAMLGLLEIVRHIIDFDRGFRFSKNAHLWITRVCQRNGLRASLAIHMPEHRFWACFRVESRLIAACDEDETSELFEKELRAAGIPLDEWALFSKARRLDCFSDLDKQQRKGLDVPEPEMIVDQETDVTRGEITRGLKTLSVQQRMILKMRYGINRRKKTLDQIAKARGVTGERVRQIQAQAERKLQRAVRRDRHRGMTAPEDDDTGNDARQQSGVAYDASIGTSPTSRPGRMSKRRRVPQVQKRTRRHPAVKAVAEHERQADLQPSNVVNKLAKESVDSA